MAAAEGRKAHARERRGDLIFLPWKDLHDRSDCVIFIAITKFCANEAFARG